MPVGSIRVVSKRKGGTAADPGESIIDVDRTNPVLGNRHILHDHLDDAERARVIAAYESDFEADVLAGGKKLQATREIAERLCNGERIALRCWCAPRPCHAEIIRAKAYELACISPIEPVAMENLYQQDSLFSEP